MTLYSAMIIFFFAGRGGTLSKWPFYSISNDTYSRRVKEEIRLLLYPGIEWVVRFLEFTSEEALGKAGLRGMEYAAEEAD